MLSGFSAVAYPDWHRLLNILDVVSTSLDGEHMVLGECKSLARPAGPADIEKILRTVLSKNVPAGVGSHTARREFVIFVPEVQDGINIDGAGITVIDGKRVFDAMPEIAGDEQTI